MPTQGTDGRPTHGLGAAVKEVAERASSIVRLELELAAMELRRKIFSLGLGIALPAIPILARSFDVGFGLASFVRRQLVREILDHIHLAARPHDGDSDGIE